MIDLFLSIIYTSLKFTGIIIFTGVFIYVSMVLIIIGLWLLKCFYDTVDINNR